MASLKSADRAESRLFSKRARRSYGLAYEYRGGALVRSLKLPLSHLANSTILLYGVTLREIMIVLSNNREAKPQLLLSFMCIATHKCVSVLLRVTSLRINTLDTALHILWLSISDHRLTFKTNTLRFRVEMCIARAISLPRQMRPKF